MNDRPRVLVVDDEPQILRALRIILREAGFEVLQAATAEEALDMAALKPPAAAIIDLVLPDRDGVEVTKELRAWSSMPILVLSAVGEEDEKVRALAAGADDYVTKPFGPRELVARLEAALRRAAPGVSEPVIEADGLRIDLAAHTVSVDGAGVHLTPIEFNLLRVLATNRGRLLTHRTLLVDVWGPEYAEDVQVLRVHMSNLRRKIGARYLHTDPGVGYRFALLVDDEARVAQAAQHFRGQVRAPGLRRFLVRVHLHAEPVALVARVDVDLPREREALRHPGGEAIRVQLVVDVLHEPGGHAVVRGPEVVGLPGGRRVEPHRAVRGHGRVLEVHVARDVAAPVARPARRLAQRRVGELRGHQLRCPLDGDLSPLLEVRVLHANQLNGICMRRAGVCTGP